MRDMFFKGFSFIWLVLLLGLFDQPSYSQTEIPTFSQEVSVSIVNLYASVRDSKGRPVYALKKEDFDLFVDGQRQKITNFSGDITEPLNIVFMLDVSGSMRFGNKFENAKQIIRGITAKLGPEDEVAFIIFADGEAQMLRDFTKDKASVIKRMEQLKAYGGTALRDAIAYCHRLLIHALGKKGVLLFSDGVDTRSDLTLEQAAEQASKVELPIYTFELTREKWIEGISEEQVNELPLKVFAETTGGLYFNMDESAEEEIDTACAKIFEDLKYQYYIGYVPKNASTYGKLELKTKDPKHQVRVRYSAVHGG